MKLSDHPSLQAAVNGLLDDLDVADALVEVRDKGSAEAVLSAAMASAKPSRLTTRASDLGIRNGDDARAVWRKEPVVGQA